MQTSRILLLSKTIFLSLPLMLLFMIAACSGPTLPELPTQSQGEESLAVEVDDNNETVESAASTESESIAESDSESDKQAGVAVAAEAAETVTETIAESDNAADDTTADEALVEESAQEAPAESAAATVDNWLTVTSRVDHELAAIGNPDAPLSIIEFSDFM